MSPASFGQSYCPSAESVLAAQSTISETIGRVIVVFLLRCCRLRGDQFILIFGHDPLPLCDRRNRASILRSIKYIVLTVPFTVCRSDRKRASCSLTSCMISEVGEVQVNDVHIPINLVDGLWKFIAIPQPRFKDPQVNVVHAVVFVGTSSAGWWGRALVGRPGRPFTRHSENKQLHQRCADRCVVPWSGQALQESGWKTSSCDIHGATRTGGTELACMIAHPVLQCSSMSIANSYRTKHNA